MSFEEVFPYLATYNGGYGTSFYQRRQLNCLYNQAIRLARTNTVENISLAITLCYSILEQNKNHVEARLLVDYLCSL